MEVTMLFSFALVQSMFPDELVSQPVDALQSG